MMFGEGRGDRIRWERAFPETEVAVDRGPCGRVGSDLSYSVFSGAGMDGELPRSCGVVLRAERCAGDSGVEDAIGDRRGRLDGIAHHGERDAFNGE